MTKSDALFYQNIAPKECFSTFVSAPLIFTLCFKDAKMCQYN